MFHLDLSVLPSIRSLLVPFLSFFLLKNNLCERTESGMLLAPIKSFRVCISHQSDRRIRLCISHQSERRFCYLV